jgi:hypothetical protein
VLTTLTLNAAELSNKALTGFSKPNAKLPISTPDRIIKARGGMITAQIFLSTRYLLIIIREVKPKSMLEAESKATVKSKETGVSKQTC